MRIEPRFSRVPPRAETTTLLFVDMQRIWIDNASGYYRDRLHGAPLAELLVAEVDHGRDDGELLGAGVPARVPEREQPDEHGSDDQDQEDEERDHPPLPAPPRLPRRLAVRHRTAGGTLSRHGLTTRLAGVGARILDRIARLGHLLVPGRGRPSRAPARSSRRGSRLLPTIGSPEVSP